MLEKINFEKVDQLIAEGRLFRAKETLHGMTGSYGYQPSIFQKIGDILVALNEPELAARYYFFSGVRTEVTQPLVDGYVRGLQKLKVGAGNKKAFSTYKDLYDEIPKAIRRAKPNEIPSTIKDELSSVGFTPDLFEIWHQYKRSREQVQLIDPPHPFYSIAKWIIILAFWFALVIVFLSGFAAVGGISHALVHAIFSNP
jgi:hypothetical protein